MRTFTLERDVDSSGISGTGTVAEGVEFSDGVVALRWLVPAGAPGAGNPTSVVFHDRGMESVRIIHGHSGQTRIVWSDPPLARDQLERGQSARQRLAAWRRQELAAGHRIGVAEEVAWLCEQLDALTAEPLNPDLARALRHVVAMDDDEIAHGGVTLTDSAAIEVLRRFVGPGPLDPQEWWRFVDQPAVQVLPVQLDAAHASAAEVEDIAKAGP